MKYSMDKLGTRKGDLMNSLIMEMASDIAVEMAEKDWGDTRAGFWVYDILGNMSMGEEAQGIFNEYYDIYMDIFYTFVNQAVEIDVNETK